MSSSFTGKNLIFLISQPRAGSTMLQKILGSHPEIYTVSEPWLLLHPLYALRDRGYQAEYNAKVAKQALTSFLDLFPNKEQVYLETVADVYGKLYQKALAQTEKTYFLDKTPRYYNIIPELASTFPDANFIILLRNPLAVLCSIISTWIITDRRRWFKLSNFKHDLLKAPELLLKGVDILKERCFIMSYEELLQNPLEQINCLCEKLEIDFDPHILDINTTNSNKWLFGDKKDPYKSSKPNISNIENWQKNLNSPQIWRLLNNYLNFLGPETMQKMGYSYESMHQYLEQYYPYYRLALLNTLSLENMLKKQNNHTSSKYRYYRIDIINKLEKKGIWNIFSMLPEKINKQ